MFSLKVRVTCGSFRAELLEYGAATLRGKNKNCMYHGSTGTYVTWSTIYGAGMWLILRQCALCGKSHDGLVHSLGGIGPPAGAATISGICWVYGGVLHCIWTPFGPCNHFAICLASPDASEVCAVCNDVQPKKDLLDIIFEFWVEKTCFLSFSSKSHAESFRNFVKNLILNPKRVKLDQKS